MDGLKDYRKAEELYQRALEGNEAQLGKDHEDTKQSAMNLRDCFYRMAADLEERYPGLDGDEDDSDELGDEENAVPFMFDENDADY